MYTLQNNLGLPSLPLARMLTSILPFLAVASPGILMATDVSNTASVSAPGDAIEAEGGNNAVTDTDTLLVPFSELSGTVYLDVEGNREVDEADPLLQGWIVEIYDGDTLVVSATTDSDGNYVVEGLTAGTPYRVKFRDPETLVVYEIISGVRLEVASSLPDQNLPIDPSGVVYDSVTRATVAGAVVTMVDRNGHPLPEDCYLDASQSGQITGVSGNYRFDILPGADPACPVGEAEYAIRLTPPAGYSYTSSILPPQRGSLDPTGRGSPFLVSPSLTVPLDADPVYYVSFRLQSGDPDIIFNHLPLDPFLSREGLIVTKTSTRRSASTGDLVPYEITVRNEEPYRRAGVNVIDVLPPGMTYVTGTARVNGITSEPQLANGNRELVWSDQVIPPNGSVTYELVLIVGAGITEGQAVNTGLAENDFDGSAVSNRGTATVSIIPSAVFDCAELIGQVFHDYNNNGYQDDGEPGIPSVRLATVNGELVTTDEHGRYHIACAAVPDARIGSNYVLRLDERALPQGWFVTTDNPRSIRLTRGKLSELNFGAAEADLVTLQMDARAFAADGSVQPDVLARLQTLGQGDPGALVIRATYAIGISDDPATIEARIATINTALSSVFAGGWEGPDPVIQVDAASTTPAESGE